MTRLTDDEKRRGVVTFSSGNHGQAIALCGTMLQIPTVVIMPADAPAVKIAGTRQKRRRGDPLQPRGGIPRADRRPACRASAA
jgi:hypothetical protein